MTALRPILTALAVLAYRAHWLVTVRRCIHFVSLIFSRRDVVLGGQRLAQCQACDMFDPKRQTCGYIGEMMWCDDTKRVEPVGCWCYMPIAARVVNKDCWLRECGGEKGWSDALRRT